MNNLSIILNLLIISFISCYYTSIKTQRHSVNTTNLLNTENENLTNNNSNSKNMMQSENNIEYTMLHLKNYKDVQYTGDIYVGTPYIKYSVIYDTGSNLFWIPSINCTLKCRNNTNKYNPELSSTSINLHIKKNISYAKGYIKGRLYKDKICLNKKLGFSYLYNKELSADNFKLIAAYKEKYLFRTIFDGIVGLGINDEGDIYNSLIKTLYNQNEITIPSFSFYLLSYKANPNINNKNEISRLYIGDILENNYINQLFKNKIKYCYLPEKSDFWLCQSISIKLEYSNKTKNIKTKSGLIFDTGTSYTIIPKNDSLNVMDYFNNTLNKNCIVTKYNQILCQCNSTKEFGEIKIFFNENNFYRINFEDIIEYYQNYRYQCHFQMLVDKIDFGIWVIGDSSLRGSLITFNMEDRKISFIQSINDVIDDNKISSNFIGKNNWIGNALLWILIFGGILLVVLLIIYILK